MLCFSLQMQKKPNICGEVLDRVTGPRVWIFGENEFAYFLFSFLEPRILLQLHQNRPRISNCDRSSSIHQRAKRAAGMKEDHFSLYTWSNVFITQDSDCDMERVFHLLVLSSMLWSQV